MHLRAVLLMVGLHSKGSPQQQMSCKGFFSIPHPLSPNFTYKGEIFWTIRFPKEQTWRAELVISFLCRGAPAEATTNPSEQVSSCTGRCRGSPTLMGKGTGDGLRASNSSWPVFEQGIKASLITATSSSSYIIQFWFYSFLLQFEPHYYTQKRTREKMVNNTTVFPGCQCRVLGIRQGETPVNLRQEAGVKAVILISSCSSQ